MESLKKIKTCQLQLLFVAIILVILLLNYYYSFNYEHVFHTIFQLKNFLISSVIVFTCFLKRCSFIVWCMDDENLPNETANDFNQAKTPAIKINIPNVVSDVAITDKLSTTPTPNIQHPLDLSIKVGASVKLEATDVAVAATILTGGAALISQLPRNTRAAGVAGTLRAAVIGTIGASGIRGYNEQQLLESHHAHVERMYQ